MVYDASKSGLNAVLYAPWFALATVDTLLLSMDRGYWSADNDFGEMFLNFWMHDEDVRKYCGVDLTHYYPAQRSTKAVWEAWTRMAMGLRPSPYQAVQSGLRAKRVALGDRHDESNVFRWDRVILNLPVEEKIVTPVCRGCIGSGRMERLQRTSFLL